MKKNQCNLQAVGSDPAIQITRSTTSTIFTSLMWCFFFISDSFQKRNGRKLFALRHHFNTLTQWGSDPAVIKEGKGCNQLLANGAKPYLTSESIRLDNVNRKVTKVTKVDPLEGEIISFLKRYDKTTSLSELSCLLKVSENELKETLLLMEMSGAIQWRGAGAILLMKKR